MTLSISQVSDNPFVPGVFAETYVPDQLIAGAFNLVTQPITVSGSAALVRGSVLGQIDSYGAIVTAASGNTGNGSVENIAVSGTAVVGDYTLTATSATNFTVTNPEGTAMAAATVGTAYSASGVAFKVVSGAAAFAAGDVFTLSVVDSIGMFTLCVKTANDGSQTPCAILVDNCDPSSGAVTTAAYSTGEFNANRVTFDASWTVELLRTALRPYAIFLKSVVSAADPT